MPPPSRLQIATSSVLRLLKEEESYHTEISTQTARIARLEVDPPSDNAAYVMKQEKQALAETVAVLARMRGTIEEAVAKLEGQLVESKLGGAGVVEEEEKAAQETVERARAVLSRITEQT